jgi:hypothetical protein
MLPDGLELDGAAPLFARRRTRFSGLHKGPINLDKVAQMFYVCSHAVLKETTKCPVPSKPFCLPPLATDWRGRRAARLAKAGREEPTFGLLNRGASVGGIAAREGLTTERARRQTGKPGNGAAMA